MLHKSQYVSLIKYILIYLIARKVPNNLSIHIAATSFQEFQVANSGAILSLVELALCPRIQWKVHQEAMSSRCI